MTGGVVPVSAIAPGELLFFARGTADAPEHVAMAIGYGCVVNGPGWPTRLRGPAKSQPGPILVVRRIAG
ncbi:hypothetical protein ACGFYF_33135 [Streptomyces lavendulae]|uniref:hypothetical protein n=1 Tax=Streptomyces lavendulae TaxID=1914 RepID=UPI00371258C5